MEQISNILMNEFFGIVLIVGPAAVIGQILGKLGFKPMEKLMLFPLLASIVGALIIGASFSPFVYHFMSNQETYSETNKIITLVLGGVGWFLMGTQYGKKN